MESTMELANSPVMWILATLIVSVVIFQTIVFYKLAKNYVKDTNILTDKEIKIALKVGAVGTIGPAVAVFTVAVVLIGLIGGPITLSRVGVIGSAAFESLAASVGSAGTAGTLDFTPSMLATASWGNDIRWIWMVNFNILINKEVRFNSRKNQKIKSKNYFIYWKFYTAYGVFRICNSRISKRYSKWNL